MHNVLEWKISFHRTGRVVTDCLVMTHVYRNLNHRTTSYKALTNLNVCEISINVTIIDNYELNTPTNHRILLLFALEYKRITRRSLNNVIT